VLVMGVNGKVGAGRGADRELARRRAVIGVVRTKRVPTRVTPMPGVDVIDASATDVATARFAELTDGKGGRTSCFNTVGDPLFSGGPHQSLALRGRQNPDRPRSTASCSSIIPGILSRPAHLCRHRYAGAIVGGDGCGF